MKKDDIFSYLSILGGLLVISPLIFAYFALDFSFLKSFVITFIIYVIMMLIAIPMFNYLQHGKFWYWVSDKHRIKFY